MHKLTFDSDHKDKIALVEYFSVKKHFRVKKNNIFQSMNIDITYNNLRILEP